MLDHLNSIFHTVPSSYNKNSKFETNIREVCIIPDFGNDPVFSYICGLKPEAPFETITILGLNFDKRIVSTDYSYASVQALGKAPKEKIIIRELPEKLVDLINNRAKNLEIEIPIKYEGDQISASKRVKVSDYLILEKLSKDTKVQAQKEDAEIEKSDKMKKTR
jgi:hypothetical protein